MPPVAGMDCVLPFCCLLCAFYVACFALIASLFFFWAMGILVFFPQSSCSSETKNSKAMALTHLRAVIASHLRSQGGLLLVLVEAFQLDWAIGELILLASAIDKHPPCPHICPQLQSIAFRILDSS
jgi:hypothetical protein